MRLATILYHGVEQAAIESDNGLLLLVELNRIFGTSWPVSVWDIIQQQELDNLKNWYNSLDLQDKIQIKPIVLESATTHLAPLFRHPGKIWGIGLNYPGHAADLSAVVPLEMPASFIKADTTLVGPGEEVQLPVLSQKVTGEAELGLVIGKEVQQGEKLDGLEALAGFCSIIDMTAEDILRKDSRYLTLSKNFDTFFCLGSELITLEEIQNPEGLLIQTVKNDRVIVQNQVKNMTFSPAELLSFHSKAMTMNPGDIISSGTPGAVILENGDTIECRIEGFRRLQNPVHDLKRKA